MAILRHPPAPFIAPVSGSIEQRLAQIADAINGKASVASVASVTAMAGTDGIQNVRRYGAVGDGVTDDTAAIQAAAAAVNATGGTLYFPPGRYLVSASTLIASNVKVTGSGWASVLVAAAAFAGPVFHNINFAATSITDRNITIENLAFDDSANPTDGGFHHLNFRMAQSCIVRGCRFDYGGDAAAFLASEDVQVLNNSAYNFRNCAWDFWEHPANVRVIGNYAESNNPAQFLNFNSILNNSSTGFVADGLVLTGNVFNNLGTTGSVLIEPLGTSATNAVKNVTVTGNVFKGVELACRGAVDGIVISGNAFSDYTGNVSAVFCYPFYGGTPGTVQVSGNNFNNIHITNPFGVIRVETSSAIITGNYVDGMGPTDGPCIYTGAAAGAVVSGNYISNGLIVAPASRAEYHAALRVAQVSAVSGDPTTTEIPDNCWAVFKNTFAGTVKLYYNDAGTLKSVALT